MPLSSQRCSSIIFRYFWLYRGVGTLPQGALWSPKFHFAREPSVPSSTLRHVVPFWKLSLCQGWFKYVNASLWWCETIRVGLTNSHGHPLRGYIFWSFCVDCFMEVYLNTALILLVNIFMIKSWVIFVLHHIARFFQHFFPVKVFEFPSHSCIEKLHVWNYFLCNTSLQFAPPNPTLLSPFIYLLRLAWPTVQIFLHSHFIRHLVCLKSWAAIIR